MMAGAIVTLFIAVTIIEKCDQVESTSGITGDHGEKQYKTSPCAPWFVIPEYPTEKPL